MLKKTNFTESILFEVLIEVELRTELLSLALNKDR